MKVYDIYSGITNNAAESAAEGFPKPSRKQLSEKFGVGKSTASDIIKRKSTLLSEWENNSAGDKQRFNASAKYENLNTLMLQWFGKARAKNIPVSGVMIQEEAKKFALDLGLTDFKASNGWLDRWKHKFSIKCFKVCGESAGVDVETVDSYKQRLPELVSGFAPCDIFNCDETGLYFRALPDRTLSAVGQSVKGTKLSKDRVTVMLACSASGEKLKPLVIGKFENPRCLKNVKRKTLPVQYSWSQKAWMNHGIFSWWIQGINRDMRKQGRHILMFLDNASSHTQTTLSNVTLKFLPPNTTSHLQPLDQGIIKGFKGIYRRHLLRSLLAQIDTSDSVSDLCRRITLLDSIHWIGKAWDEVKATTLVKCFKSSGFPTQVESVEDEEYEDDDVPLAKLQSVH